MEVDAEVRPAGEDGEEDDNEEEEGGIRIGDIYLPPPPPPACTFESNGPRLVITHIENENFKSYLGKQVLGPFHKVGGWCYACDVHLVHLSHPPSKLLNQHTSDD